MREDGKVERKNRGDGRTTATTAAIKVLHYTELTWLDYTTETYLTQYDTVISMNSFYLNAE